jgi:hypothetical protein
LQCFVCFDLGGEGGQGGARGGGDFRVSGADGAARMTDCSKMHIDLTNSTESQART